MMTSDPEQERQRLTKLYGAMHDGELQQVAEDAGSLTEIALQALADEVRRRGLDIALVSSAPPTIEEAEQRKLVTIRQFRDLPEALLAKGRLDSEGIECFLVDDNMVRMDWFISNLLGGVKLAVKEDDAEAAIEVLEQPIPEDFELEGSEVYQQPRCPSCGSLDIGHEAGLDKRFALPGLAFGGIPIPVPRNAWKCQSCGQEWQESDEPRTTAEPKIDD